MVDRYGLGRKVRGQGPGDLGGRRGAGEPGLDGGHEALDVSGGEQQPGVGEPEAGEEVGGRAGGRLLRRLWRGRGLGLCLGLARCGWDRRGEGRCGSLRQGRFRLRLRYAAGLVVRERAGGEPAAAEGDAGAGDVPGALQFVQGPADGRLR